MREITFLGMFSFSAKIIRYTEISGHSWLQSSKSRLPIKSRPFLFLDLVFSDNKKVTERTKLLFPFSSVNDINDVVSLLSIAILFLVIAFSQTN